jgi:PKHD-type hydroxylase
MMLLLQGVLEHEDLERVRAGLAEAAWLDGKLTAGFEARTVKHNEQAQFDAAREALAGFVQAALMRHPVFPLAAQLAKPLRTLFSRYRPGMAYGAHTDDAVMGEGAGRVRTDLAFTLFLSAPETYEGGALLLHGAQGETRVKLAAGDAVLYAAGALHEVEPVTSGERLAMVGWGQSLLRDPARREILFDLLQARRSLPPGEGRLLLDKCCSNLLRMWAEV